MKIHLGNFRNSFFYTCFSIFMAFIMVFTLLPNEILAQEIIDNSTFTPIEDNSTVVPEPTPTNIPEPQLPLITTIPEAIEITSNSAMIGCKLTDLGTSENVTVSLVYGEDSDYGLTTESQLLTSPAEVTFRTGDLKPETTYYFKAKAISKAGEVYGEESKFTTLAEFNPAPVETPEPPPAETPTPTPIETPVPTPEYVLPEIKTDSEVTEITSTSAVLQGSVISLGSEKSVRVYFEYGEDEKYGFSTSPEEKDSTGEFSAAVVDLKPETTYYFRAVAACSAEEIFGDNASFITLPEEIPNHP